MVLYRAWTLPAGVVVLTPETQDLIPMGMFNGVFDLTDEQADAFNEASQAYRTALGYLSEPGRQGTFVVVDNAPVGFTSDEAKKVGQENLDRVASKLGQMTRDEALAAVVDDLEQAQSVVSENGPVESDNPPIQNIGI